MQAPLDYALGDNDTLGDTPGAEAGDITYAALLDRHAAEEPITDEMIRRACLRMESAQTWPFAADPAAEDATDSAFAATLAKLFRVRR